MVRSIGSLLQASLSAITDINALLSQDYNLSLDQFAGDLKLVQASGTPTEETAYFIRKAIRAFVGQVDGVSFAIRRAVLASAAEVGLALTVRERAALSERRYERATDAISEKNALLNTPDSLKLALRYFPRLFGSTYALDSSGVAWRAFNRLVDVRNGFTHPKGFDDFSPVNALFVLQPTFMWFFHQMQLLYADCAPRIGISISLVAPMDDPFAEYDEAAHPWLTVFSEEDYRTIAANPSQSLELAKRMLAVAHSEEHRAFGELNRKDYSVLTPRGQSDARNAVRTLFSTVEAVMFTAQRFIEAAAARGAIHLSDDDRSSFTDGELEDRFVASLELWSREFGNSYRLKTSGEGWKNFRGARALRNRLTHPKEVASLHIGLNELNYILAALHYYKEAHEALRVDPEKLVALG
jgi:hypothetical protein